jgi:hypothetical protein
MVASNSAELARRLRLLEDAAQSSRTATNQGGYTATLAVTPADFNSARTSSRRRSSATATSATAAIDTGQAPTPPQPSPSPSVVSRQSSVISHQSSVITTVFDTAAISKPDSAKSMEDAARATSLHVGPTSQARPEPGARRGSATAPCPRSSMTAWRSGGCRREATI